MPLDDPWAEVLLGQIKLHPFQHTLCAVGGDGGSLRSALQGCGRDVRMSAVAPSEGALTGLRAWCAEHQTGVDFSFGDFLCAPGASQLEMFGGRASPSPPAAFAAGRFGLVIADVAATAAPRDEAAVVGRMLALTSNDGTLVLRVRGELLGREYGREVVDALGARTQLVAAQKDGGQVFLTLRRAEKGSGATLLRTLGSTPDASIIERMRANATSLLGDFVDSVGSTSAPGCEDVWIVPDWAPRGLPSMPFVRAPDVAEWRIEAPAQVVWPYDSDGERLTPPPQNVLTWLSRYRGLLRSRQVFGEPITARDVRWYEYSEHYPERWRSVPSLLVPRRTRTPRVAVLRHRAAVSRSVLSLHPRADVDPLFLAGVLSSSLAAVWMHHRFHVAPGSAIEITAVGLRELPMPAYRDDIVDLARALERAARSFTPLARAIDGDASRLIARLRSTQDANDRVRRTIAQLQRDLDASVLAAYDIQSAEFDEVYAAAERTAANAASLGEVLRNWLVRAISDAFSSGQLRSDRALSAGEISEWLRSDPLRRRVWEESDKSVERLLLDASVPLEPEYVYSSAGTLKLNMWAQGTPAPFLVDDYAARPVGPSTTTAASHRQKVWEWRGRFNTPREPFIHLIEASTRRGMAMFGWSGVNAEDREALLSDLAPAPIHQVDLQTVLEVRALVQAGSGSPMEIAEATRRTLDEVELALQSIAQAPGAPKQQG